MSATHYWMGFCNQIARYSLVVSCPYLYQNRSPLWVMLTTSPTIDDVAKFRYHSMSRNHFTNIAYNLEHEHSDILLTTDVCES